MDIERIRKEFETEIKNIDSRESLSDLHRKYLSRKGIIAQLISAIPGLPQEEKGQFGQRVNELKKEIISSVEKRQDSLVVSPRRVDSTVDIGMPGFVQYLGRRHPISQMMDEICGLFVKMGFSIVEGPEIESEYNNFTGLNIPLDHPSRDAFDTFYLKDSPCKGKGGEKNNRCSSEGRRLLLRSHTSPVQVRVMKSRIPPLAVVVPGKVYRPDAVDSSHSFMFHQIEGFMVDKGIRFSDLKGMLESFAKGIFGADIKMRFRPHFFPFTEPSAEVDISCIICKGKGCSVCGRKGWLEVLGAGMIHPAVFSNVGYGRRYTGFAFGMGVERITMLKYGITDIRMFFENDLRFLRQF